MKKNTIKYVILVLIAIVSIGLLLGVIILPPIIIDKESPNKDSEITANGLLEYIASIISAIITAILAFVSVYQTKKANEMSKRANDIENRMLRIEENNYKLHIRPFIVVTDYCFKQYTYFDILHSNNQKFIIVGELDDRSKTNGIVLTITNTTESFLMFEYDYAICKEANIQWENGGVGEFNSKKQAISLPGNEKKELIFIANNEFWLKHHSKKVWISFVLTNRFAQKYKEEFVAYFTEFKNEKSNDVRCSISFQEYSIEKIDDEM